MDDFGLNTNIENNQPHQFSDNDNICSNRTETTLGQRTLKNEKKRESRKRADNNPPAEKQADKVSDV